VELYREPGVRVTSEAFLVAGRRYPVGELTDLHTGRGPHDSLTVRAVVVTAGVLAGVGAALGYAGGLYRLSAEAYLALGVAAFVPLLLALVGNRLRPPAYELWGHYRGTRQLLFSSDHERQFGQVTRALLRAREVHRLGGTAGPIAWTGWETPPS
jgi:hypothetical protein